LLLCDLVILVLCGCTEHKRETTIEEHTRTVIDRQPVVTPDEPPSSPQPGAVRSEKTETREERIISREPVAK
jgi:hypothetical protein